MEGVANWSHFTEFLDLEIADACSFQKQDSIRAAEMRPRDIHDNLYRLATGRNDGKVQGSATIIGGVKTDVTNRLFVAQDWPSAGDSYT